MAMCTMDDEKLSLHKSLTHSLVKDSVSLQECMNQHYHWTIAAFFTKEASIITNESAFVVWDYSDKALT